MPLTRKQSPIDMAELRKAVAVRLAELSKKVKQADVRKAKLNPRTLNRMKNPEESFPQIDTLALYLDSIDVTIGEFFAPWIRPGTSDYDRECHALMLEILADRGHRGALKRILEGIAKGKIQ